MKLDIKSLLKDKNVLRIVVFLSAMNVLGYLLARDLDSVAFFGIVGFLATYFSKNMIVVLLIAMIATNFLTVLRKGKDVVEGMKNGGGNRKHTKKVDDASVKKPAAASDEEDQESDENDSTTDSQKKKIEDVVATESLKSWDDSVTSSKPLSLSESEKSGCAHLPKEVTVQLLKVSDEDEWW